MAMSAGGGRSLENEINVTPMIDVLLGVLIIFMAALPSMRKAIDVNLPDPNPQAVPWKDSISHAIRVFKGTEYTISRPRDLWFSTTEVVDRILRWKHESSSTSRSSTGRLNTTQAFH